MPTANSDLKIATSIKPVGRRSALKVMALAGGGLVLGVPRPKAQADFDPATWPGKPSDAFEYWIEIASDNTITVFIHLAEMGQGVTTSVAMLVAEELEADWKDIRVQFAPSGPAYYNRGYGGPLESTGSSASIKGAFGHSRQVGANAREMLRLAAAQAWGVPVPETRAALSYIHHDATGRAESFGGLAEAAAQQTPPSDILLKPKSDWSIVGKPQQRLDTPSKVDGSAIFGADVQFDGLLTAAIRHCPSYDGNLVSVDPAPALALNGVEHVITLDNAVAVLANGYWQAQKGLEALDPIWDLGPRSEYDMAALENDLENGINRTDLSVVREDGDIDAALDYADSVYEQTFSAPYLAHVCMEPMNATAWVRDDGVEIWMPGQGHSLVVDDVSALLGVEKETVRVHRTFLGGGFGRRGEADLPVQAAYLSKESGGRPVKLIWSREEDVRRDFFRPAARVRIQAALGEDGLPIGLDVVGAVPSINKRRFPNFIKDNLDPGAFSGFLDTPYSLDHHRIRYAMVENGVPVGYWRAVSHSQNVFFMEAMVNELAERVGMTGLDYRRAWLADNPRILAVLNAVEEMSGYGGSAEPGISKGIALNASHNTICAHVVHISSGGGADFQVERIDCVIDPGVAVNPDGVVAQVESQALDGLSNALFGKINFKNGGAADSNFDTVRMLRIAEAPIVNVRILEWESASPGGMGEPALPSIAPALTDAIYQATGRRIRSLPVVDNGLEVASA